MVSGSELLCKDTCTGNANTGINPISLYFIQQSFGDEFNEIDYVTIWTNKSFVYKLIDKRECSQIFTNFTVDSAELGDS